MHECLNTLVTEMDRLGIAGCKANRTQLAAKLRRLYDERVIVAAIDRAGLPFLVNRSNVFLSLIDEAIRRAELGENRHSAAHLN